MPLPKAPTTRGERLDIKAASRNKAKLPASRRKKSATAQAEASPALELALDPVATPAVEAVSPAVATASQGRDAGKERAAGKAGGRAQASAPVSSPAASATGTAQPAAGTRPGAEGRPAQGSTQTAALLSAPPAGSTPDAASGTVRPDTTVAPVAPARHARRHRAPGTEAATHKLFVLDTNVLMHDPTALFRFQEHDVFLPMITLEELDDHKRGMSEVSRHARQVSRSLDELLAGIEGSIEQGIPLDRLGHSDATGRLFLQTRVLEAPLPEALPPGKADNRILSVTAALRQVFPERQVVLVSKDINMRIKARSLGLPAEDYFNDQVTDDLDLLYSGSLALPADFWQTHGKDMESWQDGGMTYYRIRGPLVPSMLLNQFVYLEEDGGTPLFAQVREREGDRAVLRVVRDYTQVRHAIWGITARNREQNFALNLLLDPDIDFVTLLGQAGTGKTLLALTAGLAQTLDQKRFTEIIMTRATVPVGDDIGYLPGTEEETLDGRPRRQPGGAQPRQCRRRMGACRSGRSHPLAHPGEVDVLHARPHLQQQVPDHRRGAEPHAQADEDAGHPRGPRHQGGLPGQHRPDRHALSHRGLVGPHLRGGAFQGLEARRAPDAAARRALAAGGLRGRCALTRGSGRTGRCVGRLRKRNKCTRVEARPADGAGIPHTRTGLASDMKTTLS